MKYSKFLQAPKLSLPSFEDTDSDVRSLQVQPSPTKPPKLDWNVTGDVGSRTVFQQNSAPKPANLKRMFGPPTDHADFDD